MINERGGNVESIDGLSEEKYKSNKKASDNSDAFLL
jgi:hypothetical protein